MVYVVDDDYDVRTSLRFLLETEGFDVRTFRSGSRYLALPPGTGRIVLVVDYKMEDLDGLELGRSGLPRGLDPHHADHGVSDENISAKASLGRGTPGPFEAQPRGNLIECVRKAIDTRNAQASAEDMGRPNSV